MGKKRKVNQCWPLWWDCIACLKEMNLCLFVSGDLRLWIRISFGWPFTRRTPMDKCVNGDGEDEWCRSICAAKSVNILRSKATDNAASVELTSVNKIFTVFCISNMGSPTALSRTWKTNSFILFKKTGSHRHSGEFSTTQWLAFCTSPLHRHVPARLETITRAKR